MTGVVLMRKWKGVAFALGTTPQELGVDVVTLLSGTVHQTQPGLYLEEVRANAGAWICDPTESMETGREVGRAMPACRCNLHIVAHSWEAAVFYAAKSHRSWNDRSWEWTWQPG